MRSQHALKLLEEKTALAEEEASRAPAPRTRTAEDRKRRAAEVVGSFDGDFVTGFGKFAIAGCGEADGKPDPRITKAPSGGSEGSLVDGGALVPDQFFQLKRTLYDASALAGFADIRETANPLATTNIPGIDETSRQDGSRAGGFVRLWDHGAGLSSASWPQHKMVRLSPRLLRAPT